jgi:hypothetical protein
MCKIAAANINDRRRSPRRRWHGAFLPLLLAAVAALLAGPGQGGGTAAYAQNAANTAGASTATTYSTKRRLFKVGILLLDSTIDANNDGTISTAEAARGPENPDPYIYYIADSRTDVKPQNWEFVNPLAPATVTNDVKARWDARLGSDSGYHIGDKVSKDMAAYWEVYLTRSSLSDLLQFDLLFITNHRRTAFTPADREKLRKLVDAGGIVWLEDCGNMRIGTLDAPSTTVIRGDRFFLDELQFSGGAREASLPTNGHADGPGPVIYQPTHPILNTPYQLTFQEIANLGDKNYADYAMAKIDPTTNVAGLGQPNPEVLINIVGNNFVGSTAAGDQRQPYIAAGYYGAGAVIATSSDSGCDINDYAGGDNVGSGGNSGPRSGPNINTAHAEDLKFLYNAVAWGGANNSYRRNNRRTASTFEAVAAPLLTQFDLTDPLYDPTKDRLNSLSAPLIVNGVLFATGFNAGGQPVLNAYDTQPFRDYDGDGNFDEGRPDVSLGYGYDLIWSVNLASLGGTSGGNIQPSSPIYGEVATANTSERGRIYVSLADGTVQSYLAFPVNGFGQILATSPLKGNLAPSGGASGGLYDAALTRNVAPSPVFFEGKVYQVQPEGRVRCLGADTLNLLWQSFVSAPYVIRPAATPTLGFTRLGADAASTSQNQNGSTPSASSALANNSSGTTNDLMLYIPAEIDPASSGSGTTRGVVLSYWLGTRNEVQRGFGGDQSAAPVVINSRIAGGTGTPGPGVYGMASVAPFVTPRARVFSPTRSVGDPDLPDGTITESALLHYQQGQISKDYVAVPQLDPNTNLPNGKFIISLSASPGPNAKDPGPRAWPVNESDILISVDYDVMYVAPDGTEPPNYQQNTTRIGARFNPNLDVANYEPVIGTGGTPSLDTFGFTPEDTLIFGARQSLAATVSGAQPMLGLFGLHEEEGNTRLRWRIALSQAPLSDGSSPLVGRVDDVFVNDDYPIKNSIDFHQSWPLTDEASRPAGATYPVFIDTTVGSPIVTNEGVTYFLARGRTVQSWGNSVPVSVLIALRSEPNISLKLPIGFDPTRGVVVSQLDALSSAPNTTARTVRASTSNVGNSVLRLDGPRGRIDVLNFNAGNNSNLFSAAQSFVVSATPVGEAAPRRFIVSPRPDDLASNTAGNEGQPINVSGGFTPILWYYVLPGNPTSPPTLVGDNIYFTLRAASGGTYLIAADSDPSSNDATVRVGFSEQVPNVYARERATTAPFNVTDQKTVHVKVMPVTAPTGAPDVQAAPVAAGGVLALNTSFGAFAFSDQTTLIADARRIIEVNADASAQWTVDGTQLRSVVGGTLPQFGPNGEILNLGTPDPTAGRVAVDTKPLSHPTKVRRIGNGDYIIADTGNNRIVRVDRGGLVTWSLDTLADPYNILSGGEPTTLSGPTDIQYYVTPTVDTTGVVGYEVHYIVADPGNHRIIEVADYFNRNGVNINAPGTTGTAGQHVVVWSTRTQSGQGRQYRFESINRYLGTGTDPATGTVYSSGFPYIVATVSNVRVAGGSSSASTDFSGGSLVSLRYAPFNTTLQVRDATGNQVGYKPWQTVAAEPAGNGTILAAADDLQMRNAAGNVVVRRLARPTYFQQINLPGRDATQPTGPANPPRTVYLICDGDGVYAVYAYTGANGPVRQVLWMFRQQEYNALNLSQVTGRPAFRAGAEAELPRFAPSAARLLPNGHLLITNAWAGKSALFQNGRFTGEVLQVDPQVSLIALVNAVDNNAATPTVAGGSRYGQFSAPRILTGNFNTANGPITLNQQVMGIPGNTNLLEQPLFADRQ